MCNLIYRFITYYAVHSRRLPRRLLLPLQQGRGSCDAAAILNSDEDHPAPASTGTKRRSDTCRVAQFRPLTPRPSPRPTSYTPFRPVPRSSHIRHYTLCRVHTATTTPVSPSLLWQLKGDLTHVESLNSAPLSPAHTHPPPLTPFRPPSSFLPYSSFHTVSCTHCNYRNGVTKPSLTTKRRSDTCRVAQFSPLVPRPYPRPTPCTLSSSFLVPPTFVITHCVVYTL